MLLIESTFELAKLSEEEIKTRSRIKNFVIDSRQVKKNSVFIALKGNNPINLVDVHKMNTINVHYLNFIG